MKKIVRKNKYLQQSILWHWILDTNLVLGLPIDIIIDTYSPMLSVIPSNDSHVSATKKMTLFCSIFFTMKLVSIYFHEDV